jgi:ubiquinone/menaquinone biosynthesis C-methylase UbiE
MTTKDERPRREFDAFRDTYGTHVGDAVSFSGKGHDFFTKVKAHYLLDVIRRERFRHPVPVLDIGCGHGLIHPFLIDRPDLPIELTGIDMAESVVDVARASNPKVSYATYDGTKLPFDDASFSVAYAICVLHHVPPPQWESFLREMQRVVRPGGLVVIFEHNPLNPLTRRVVKSCALDEHAVLLRSGQLKRLLERVDFVDVSQRFILLTPIEGRAFQWLERKLGSLPLGAQHFAVARKVL